MNSLRRLVREIHRRSLWQVLGIYVVASWAVLQVVDTLGGALNLPDWFPSFAFALLLVGLPVVLATAFVQEGGPAEAENPSSSEQEQGEQRGAPAQILTWRNVLLGGFGAFALWGILALGVVIGSSGIPAMPTPEVGLGDDVRPTRLMLAVPPGTETMPGRGFDISPDGRTIVFGRDQTGRLLRRRLGGLEVASVPGTENAWMPFFSPDGEWIAFFDNVDNTLKRVRLDGSDLETLAAVPPTARSGGWSENGTIVFNSTGIGGLSLIAPSGGTVDRVAEAAGPILWLDLLPGGNAVLGHHVVRDEPQVVVVSLETGYAVPLFAGITPRYVSPGRIVYWRDGSLWAVPFDPDRLEVTGLPVLVEQNVRSGTNRHAYFDVTEELLVYQPGGTVGVGSGVPVWVDREGNQEPLELDSGLYSWPRISPDGTRIAVMREQGGRDILVFERETGTSIQLTFSAADDRAPIWTPDGERLVFSSSRDGAYNLYLKRADGAGPVERLTESPQDQTPYDFTPDGSTLVMEQVDEDGGSDLWAISLDSGSEPVAVLQGRHSETQAALSPDGRFVAYQSSELGYPEIFVRPFPALDGQWLISTLDVAPASGIANADPREGRSPVWSRDGTEIFYLSGNQVVRVPVEAAGGFRHGTPVALFEGFWIVPSEGPQYDVSPDGERLLMVAMGGAGTSWREGDLIVVQNWARELDQREARR